MGAYEDDIASGICIRPVQVVAAASMSTWVRQASSVTRAQVYKVAKITKQFADCVR